MWRTLRPSAGQAQQWVREWVTCMGSVKKLHSLTHGFSYFTKPSLILSTLMLVTRSELLLVHYFCRFIVSSVSSDLKSVIIIIIWCLQLLTDLFMSISKNTCNIYLLTLGTWKHVRATVHCFIIVVFKYC